MSKMTKSLVAASVLAASTLVSGNAMAGASGNIGMVSDYFFRGINQESGATASAGLDYEISGVYVGTWVADVEDGAEYDLYAGYAGEVSGFSYDIGYYTYNYTGEFDDTYAEGMLTVGYGPISASYAKGTYDNFDGPELDYTFASITAEYNGFYGTYGSHGDDFEGKYVEVGYGTSIADWDAGIAIINSDEDLSNTVDADGDPSSDMSVVFSVGKSFDF